MRRLSGCASSHITGVFAAVIVGLVAVSLLSTPVAAHQVATRFESPIPLSLLFLGAGATVGLTAAVLAGRKRRPSAKGTGRVETSPAGRSVSTLAAVPSTPAKLVRAVAGGGFFLAIVAALVHGAIGPSAPSTNFATLFVWPVWFKGVALVSVVVGSPWGTLSPWRNLYRLLCRLEGGEVRLRAYPEQLGEWPAVVGFLLLVGVAENLTVIPSRPSLTAALVAGYALTMLAGGVVFGLTWFDRADPLSILYRLLGRVAPLRTVRAEDEGSGGNGEWQVVARPPWRGCLSPVSIAEAAFVVAAVYTVSFDGFSASPEYQAIFYSLRDVTGLGPEASLTLYFVGLAGFLAAFATVARVVSAYVGNEGDHGDSHHTSATAFAATLLPIAAAYEVAHNYGYALTGLGALPSAVGAETVDPLFWLTLPAFWLTQVALVVLGHVVAVVAADAVSRRVAGDSRSALAAHAPLATLMVGYTVLSLWIISRPVAV
ncbi:hypothetical protein [Haloprofundus salilacus]|uniref:hypothetical protein n=1 Tax=Haloprofundus salilacus TaxID=2876190 RepID=UPI001CCE341E|nr:hypothetical protein [Haloprofundus salilacus]